MNVINNLIKNSTYQVYEDGTVSFTLQIGLYAITKITTDALEKSAETTIVRNHMVVHSKNGFNYSWSATITPRYLTFTYNDYTIPMNIK